MKNSKAKSRAPILAAGGIVLRGDRKPHIALVQLRKLNAWVLPKGKLNGKEDALAAARREVLEETGYRVSVHEFLGALAYEAAGRPKVVQFWRMQAEGEPVCDLMDDIRAMRWFTLAEAIRWLTHPREQVFLANVGPIAIKAATRPMRKPVSRAKPVRKRPSKPAPALVADARQSLPQFDPRELVQPASFQPDLVDVIPPMYDVGIAPSDLPSVTAAAPLVTPLGRPLVGSAGTEGAKQLVKLAWTWFRHPGLAYRQTHD
jgi:8-oxo-dGTP diphosphatase